MSCSTSVSWLYRLESNYSWDSGLSVPEVLVFVDAKGKVRLIIEEDGKVTVTRGYSWNGCSPKFCVFDLMLGTPEGVVHKQTGRPKTYFASLVHDAMYQFVGTHPHIKRRHADAFFKRLLRESDFGPAWLYWAAVRLAGWLVWRGKKAKRHWRSRGGRVEEMFEGSEVITRVPEQPRPGTDVTD